MRAKQYLYQLIINEKRKENRMRQLDELRSHALSIGGFDYSQDRVVTSSAGDKMASDVTAYVALEEKIKKECVEYEQTKNKIVEQINGLDNALHIELLYLRYASGLSLTDVARRMGYTYDWIKHKHGDALWEFECRYLK